MHPWTALAISPGQLILLVGELGIGGRGGSDSSTRTSSAIAKAACARKQRPSRYEAVVRQPRTACQHLARGGRPLSLSKIFSEDWIVEFAS